MDKNLNPYNLEEVDEILQKSKDKQLYFFLDDSIPHEQKETIIFFNKTASERPEDGILSDATEYTTNVSFSQLKQ